MKPVVITRVSLSLLKTAYSIQSKDIEFWVSCKEKAGSNRVQSPCLMFSRIILMKTSVSGRVKANFGNSFIKVSEVFLRPRRE